MTGVEMREARLALGLSQVQLGHLLERKGNTISRMERGASYVGRRTELAIRHLSTLSRASLELELRQAIVEDVSVTEPEARLHDCRV